MTITARFQKATGISGTVADSLRISTASGTLIVESGKEMKLPIYSTDGRLVEMLPVAAGKNLFNGLGKGAYIVKGTKVILR